MEDPETIKIVKWSRRYVGVRFLNWNAYENSLRRSKRPECSKKLKDRYSWKCLGCQRDLTANLLTHLGKLWPFLAQEMHLEFIASVYIGATITAEAEVVEIDEDRYWFRLDCRCLNRKGNEVLRAEVCEFPGRFGA